ncbi:DUF1643 domain-containing protein [Glutamicibacter sp. PAEs-4]|uniref:DUF1643 domain-containing protein n=1 Tax=Glutamicibacter sp. PAEs-4 TaxID=3444114 RepID=UPI003EC1510B
MSTTQDELAGSVEGWAEISNDGRYRYLLGRRWDASLPECTFIMLNPSTADARQDDPTIRRCINFAKSYGCGSLLVGNLYAFRATDPRDLFRADDPVGGEMNDEVLIDLLARSELVIAAWGAHAHPSRVAEVLRLPGAERMLALATTKAGAPRHPLYLSKTVTPVVWKANQ